MATIIDVLLQGLASILFICMCFTWVKKHLYETQTPSMKCEARVHGVCV